jgi:hypothetical protein
MHAIIPSRLRLCNASVFNVDISPTRCSGGSLHELIDLISPRDAILRSGFSNREGAGHASSINRFCDVPGSCGLLLANILSSVSTGKGITVRRLAQNHSCTSSTSGAPTQLQSDRQGQS